MKIRLLILTVLALLSGCARAECNYAKAPAAVPEGYTATQADMTKSTQAFKAYNDAMNAYIGCVDQEAAAAIAKGRDLTPEQVQQINADATKKHDAAVDDLQVHVEEFNTEVRAFNMVHQ